MIKKETTSYWFSIACRQVCVVFVSYFLKPFCSYVITKFAKRQGNSLAYGFLCVITTIKLRKKVKIQIKKMIKKLNKKALQFEIIFYYSHFMVFILF